MISPRHALLERLRTALPALGKEFPVRRMALFGSVVRGEATDASDIDILVEVDPSIGLGFVTLAEWLEQLLGHKVDLVSRGP
jgi:uncharacterized protein